MPSLLTFFSICEYLDTTPGEFFRDEKEELEIDGYFSVMQDLEELSPEQLGCIEIWSGNWQIRVDYNIVTFQ